MAWVSFPDNERNFQPLQWGEVSFLGAPAGLMMWNVRFSWTSDWKGRPLAAEVRRKICPNVS